MDNEVMSNAYGLPAFDVDPYDPALLLAPAEYYRALRAHGPLVYIPRYGVCASGHIAVLVDEALAMGEIEGVSAAL